MKVLITGGGGFLGSHLADAFLKRGDEVFILDTAPDLKVRHNLQNPKFHYIKNSIFEKDLLESLIIKCDLIYHLAAVVGVEHYVGDPLSVLNVNVNGTQSILKLAHRHDKKVVFSSTSEVYGKNPKIPFTEESERVLGPTHIDRWCYSTSKATGEHFCFAYGKLGLKFVIVRYFNAYGPRLDWIDVGRVITIFMGQLLRGEDITLIGDGRQTRCFTYVDDAIEATVNAGLFQEAEGQIINIGTDVETPIKELAETMIELYPTGSQIKYVKQETIYGESYEDIPRRVPAVQKMKELLKVTAKTPLKEGVMKTIEWFRDEFPKIQNKK